MPILHLGPVQLEVGRRPLAGMMIPPVGEKDAADIQKQAGDDRRLLHWLLPVPRIIAGSTSITLPMPLLVVWDYANRRLRR